MVYALVTFNATFLKCDMIYLSTVTNKYSSLSKTNDYDNVYFDEELDLTQSEEEVNMMTLI